MANQTNNKTKFIEYAAKSIWAFICAFASAFVASIVSPLLAGKFPTVPDYLVALALGLIAGFGTGGAVYGATNKDRVG